MVRRRLRLGLLLFWLVGILFPLAWLGRFSNAYRQVFNTIFGPDWMHVLMHAMLYAGLVILILQLFSSRLDRKTFIKLAGVILLVGVSQEALQAAGAGVLLPGAALFDLGVDLIGGLIGWCLVLLIRQRSQG